MLISCALLGNNDVSLASILTGKSNFAKQRFVPYDIKAFKPASKHRQYKIVRSFCEGPKGACKHCLIESISSVNAKVKRSEIADDFL